jgi:hypothetical protein
MIFQVTGTHCYTYKLTYLEDFRNSFSQVKMLMKLCGKKWIQKICKICDVLQIYVYLFINKSYCHQVYSSLKYFMLVSCLLYYFSTTL